MAWKVHFAFCSERHERDLIDKHGSCCEAPCIVALYSLYSDANNDDYSEGHFIRFECFVCCKYLESAQRESEKVWQWT